MSTDNKDAVRNAALEEAPAHESAIIAQQVASWRKEVTRLNDLIAFAGGRADAPMTNAARLDWLYRTTMAGMVHPHYSKREWLESIDAELARSTGKHGGESAS